MERLIAIVAAAAVLSWLVAPLVIRRARRHQGAAIARLAGEVERERGRVETLVRGEREAAWSARALGRLAEERLAELAQASAALQVALGQSAGLEATIDALRDDLGATLTDLEATRRDLDAATTRLAALEGELARRSPQDDGGALPGRIAALQDELAATRRAVATHAAEARELRYRLAASQRAATAPSPGAVDELIAELEALRQKADDTALVDRISQLEAALAEARASLANSPWGESATLAGQIGELQTALAAAEEAAAAAGDDRGEMEAALADFRGRVAAAEREAAARRDEVRLGREEIDRLRRAADEFRGEADRRLAAAGGRIADLERSARSGEREAALLTARDAVISDLEQRLAALGSARNAELRRLNEKIASMERLYIEVEVRDRRVTLLEEELKDTAEARDAALAEVVRLEREAVDLRAAHAAATASLERFAGLERELLSARARTVELEERLAGDALGVEVERLRGALDAERDRADRAVQRSALSDQAPQTYAAWDARSRDRVEAAVAEAVAPLRARIDHLHAVVIEKERRLAALAGLTDERVGDDLTRIRGIGPKINAILQELGVTTFRDIAAFTDDDVSRIGAHLPVFGGRIIADDWINQARRLAD